MKKNPFKKITLTVLLFLSSIRLEAGDSFAVDVTAGLPHLVSLELSYLGFGPVALGVGFGSLPINSVLRRNIPMDTRSVSGGYTLYPDASYSFTTISAFLRYFPFNQGKGSGTFFELNVARWRFGSNVSGDLQNDNTGGTLGNALSGQIEFEQPMASLFVGYRSLMTQSLFLQFGVGATYLFESTHTTSVGGTLNSVLPLANQATIDSFEQAKVDINNQVDSGVAKLESTTKILPAVWLGVGWIF